MEDLTVAFDIDGTLRCNCTPTCQDINSPIASLARILSTMKNVTVIAWSGGGVAYTRAFIEQYPQLKEIFRGRYYDKLNPPHVDIAIDDQHDFTMADKNMIVRMK